MNNDYISIKGAKVHNLKNVSVNIPKNKITVITGLSGSGKSSLAFDTIYAEGQRRYVENLSSYAKQVLGILNKPEIDSAEGLIPAIAIDQKTVARSPRSTVGTLTEIYDLLRILFANAGQPKCIKCNTNVIAHNPTSILNDILKISSKELKTIIFAYTLNNELRQQKIKSVISKLKKSKFNDFIINNYKFTKADLKGYKIVKNIPYNVCIITGEFDKRHYQESNIKQLLTNAIDSALGIGNGKIYAQIDKKVTPYWLNFACPNCHSIFPQISTRLFSFNNPQGACANCHGLGLKKHIDPNMVIPNQRLTLSEGAIRPWSRMANQTSWYYKTLRDLARRNDFSVDTPIYELSNESKKKLLYGDGIFEGVINNLERKYHETSSEYLRSEIEKYMVDKICAVCQGKRLRPEALNVFINNKNIHEISSLTVEEYSKNIDEIKVESSKKNIIEPIIRDIKKRLNNLDQVGLSYLTLDRQADTLAGGEAQRIRLATQLNGVLTGVLYVLDEPSIGLHPDDIDKLIITLKHLRDNGNTLVIVEHEAKIIKEADYIIDVGPLAGEQGGRIVAEGTYSQIKNNKRSLTGSYLNGRKLITPPKKRRKIIKNNSINIYGAIEYNLQNVDATIPLNALVCISGVSGSGKSTLIYNILGKKAASYFHRAQAPAGKHEKITGFDKVNKVINIDQSPIGRTPRSNLATYTGIFGPIRTLFAAQQDAKVKGLTASHFSFNLKGGRCEACHGDGLIKVEMHFLPDVYVTCEECGGKRYNSDALDVTFNEKTISDILDLTVDAAADFFKDEPAIKDKIAILQAVGLGYVPLGQSATTLSGGEAQRIKLATELSRADTGRTLYILDEPTTGLHFEDISKLLIVLQKLVDKGNTVLIIEHNLDVLKSADWIIDMGPGGGKYGGKIVATGSPEQLAKIKNSLTGKYLKIALKQMT